ncbi:hypothetical protein AGABI1DRAFT_114088 [Agaricus bisporus var. burnettii JB137-S8]|uniref:Uncharacterized protein n=1 Tax=Agaricus bisporus var. burnettii (strain JB137-S8 / ATCC MYA-4627 / FGSC 10392) TaxID=597362 RepID=K5VYI7_AGABU|nr:uncharacterized protein AGABI1DRAFT_114088 [Agaricus bisporus var. burnettii JB137-S8]EKM79554.1 hypothetical protein AGABI1DRAFT_114088 [Agaricus bisporus var. burnettii JB137-S8]
MLSNKKEKSVLKFSIKRVADDATALAAQMGEARKMIHEFEKKIKEEELPKITEAMKKNKSTNKKVFTEANLQVLTDFFKAAHEYGTLLQSNSDYFEAMAKLVHDERTSLPSDPEIERMREVWQAFTQKTAGLERGLDDIEDGIWEGKKIRDAKDPSNPFRDKSKISEDASDRSSRSSRASSRKSFSRRFFPFLHREHS